MFRRDPSPVREDPRPRPWAPPAAAPEASAPPVAPRATHPASRAAEVARPERPVGFAVLAVLLALSSVTAIADWMRMDSVPSGVLNAALGLVGIARLGGGVVLAIGLWRCERWVSRAALLWGAATAAHYALVVHLLASRGVSGPAVVLVMLVPLGLAVAVVAYVLYSARTLRLSR